MKKIIAALSAAMVLATGSSLGAFADDYPNSYVQKFKDGIFITDTNKDGKFVKAVAILTLVIMQPAKLIMMSVKLILLKSRII